MRLAKDLRAAVAIAHAGLLVALRNRVLLLVVLLSMLLVAASVAAASVSIFERSRIILDLGLAATSIMGSLSAIGLSIMAINGDVRNRTAYTLLVRPLSRWAFVLGKYLGVAMTVTLLTTVLWLTTALTVWGFGGSVPPAFFASLWLLWLEVWLVASVASAFSCLSQPVMAGIFSIGTIVGGQFTQDMVSLSEQLTRDNNETYAHLLQLAQLLLPNLQSLSLRSEAANALPVPTDYLAYASLYALLYTTAALSAAMWLFGRKRHF